MPSNKEPIASRKEKLKKALDNTPLPGKHGVQYSKETVNRIAEKLLMGLSLKKISIEYDWCPNYETMLRWQKEDSYTKEAWNEAKTHGMQQRLLDKLDRISKVDFDKMATDCSTKENLTPAIRTQLFAVKAAHVYKEMDYLYKQLSHELPEKYGQKVRQEIDIKGQIGSTSTEDLKKLVNDLVKMDPELLIDKSDNIHYLIDITPEDEED